MNLICQRTKEGDLFGVAYDAGNGQYLIVKSAADGRFEMVASRDWKTEAITLYDELSLADKVNPEPDVPASKLPRGMRGRLSALAERLSS